MPHGTHALLSTLDTVPAYQCHLWPEQVHLVLLPGKDVFDAGADFRLGGVGPRGMFGHGRYPLQSEADLALAKLLMPFTDSLRECWLTFRFSKLGECEKARRTDYARSTLALAARNRKRGACG